MVGSFGRIIRAPSAETPAVPFTWVPVACLPVLAPALGGGRRVAGGGWRRAAGGSGYFLSLLVPRGASGAPLGTILGPFWSFLASRARPGPPRRRGPGRDPPKPGRVTYKRPPDDIVSAILGPFGLPGGSRVGSVRAPFSGPFSGPFRGPSRAPPGADPGPIWGPNLVQNGPKTDPETEPETDRARDSLRDQLWVQNRCPTGPKNIKILLVFL